MKGLMKVFSSKSAILKEWGTIKGYMWSSIWKIIPLIDCRKGELTAKKKCLDVGEARKMVHDRNE